jgi:hypothetical protein
MPRLAAMAARSTMREKAGGAGRYRPIMTSFRKTTPFRFSVANATVEHDEISHEQTRLFVNCSFYEQYVRSFRGPLPSTAQRRLAVQNLPPEQKQKWFHIL